MPDQRIVNFEGKTQAFPADATDAEISAALNAIPAANAASVPKAKTWTDWAVDKIPAVGATAGGIIGGVAGAGAGGIGGVPGAAVGAGLGGAAGEAAKQLINRARGAEAPQTATDAALAIGKEGAIDAATTGAVGAAGKALRPVAGTVLQRVGAQMESPSTLRQLAGQGVSAAGRAIDSANAPAAAKMSLNSADYLKIQQLKAIGVSEGEAVSKVWNQKVAALLRQ